MRRLALVGTTQAPQSIPNRSGNFFTREFFVRVTLQRVSHHL
jgi:hypothetical protein